MSGHFIASVDRFDRARRAPPPVLYRCRASTAAACAAGLSILSRCAY